MLAIGPNPITFPFVIAKEERPLPSKIVVGLKKIHLFFETPEDVATFCDTSREFMRDYPNSEGENVPFLDFTFSGRTTSAAIMQELAGLYPGKDLVVKRFCRKEIPKEICSKKGRPLPKRIWKGPEKLSLVFRERKDLKNFLSNSKTFMGQYPYKADKILPILWIEWSKINTMETIIKKLGDLYPGKNLVIKDLF